MEVVTLNREGEQARIRFARSDKSVNVLDEGCMAGLEAILTELEKEPPHTLVLESGMPGNFIAGADLHAIAGVTDRAEATRLAERGQALCRRIEALPAISVAVVQGSYMGGGLEMAMACDHLLAVRSSKTQLALPEVKIGIHPGFGGCVRLPRRVGWVMATEMILSGRSINARKAKKTGLADLTCHAGQIEEAIVRLAARGKQQRRARSPWWFHLWPARMLFFRLARQKVEQKFDHLDLEAAYPAIPGALATLRDIYGMSDGLAYAREAESLGRLAVTPTCKSLIRVFFLGEALKKQDAVRKGKKAAAEMGHTAVYGAGAMGHGIAWVATKTGHVDLHEVSDKALGHGMQQLNSLSRREPERLRSIRPVLDDSGLANSDVVIEAVLEESEVKRELWARVEAGVADDALLLTNTSSLSVAEQQKVLNKPGRMAGLHFFNPAPKMPLVEVIAGPKTHKKTLQAAAALAVRWGKYPVIVSDKPGFLVNRCLMPFMLAALRLLERGQSVEHVDGALKHYGMPMGAIELADKVGLDICHHVGTHLSEAYGARMQLPEWFGKMVEKGLLGQKSGAGFYAWNGSQQGGVNPKLAEYLPNPLSAEHEGDASIADHGEPMPDADILDTCLLPMLAEALACLDEKVVGDAAHLDAAMVYGLGFPPFRGGLLHAFANRDREELAAAFEQQGLKVPANLDILNEQGSLPGS
jgi:3-hydroxyacyl-CoA dehydrogenase/enoyl-CoA hydratase/3-hydroxybutyryl-CoA epimerase